MQNQYSRTQLLLGAFAVGVTVTMICIRCKKKKTIRMEAAEETEGTR